MLRQTYIEQLQITPSKFSIISHELATLSPSTLFATMTSSFSLIYTDPIFVLDVVCS